jgi:hypothetical protein
MEKQWRGYLATPFGKARMRKHPDTAERRYKRGLRVANTAGIGVGVLLVVLGILGIAQSI